MNTKSFILCACMVFSLANASMGVVAYDIRMVTRNGTNTANINTDVSLPGTGTLDGILCASGTTHLPVYKLFGGGLVMGSTSVYVDYTTIAVGGGINLDDWMGAVDNDLDAAQSDISTLQSGKMNASAVSTVGQTGQYSDLLGLPTLFDGTWASLTGKPSFSTVATSGDYADLSNKPSLGTAAAQNVGAFATAAQGALADSAVQPAAISSFITASALSPYALTSSVPTNTNQLTNGAGFITGITGGNVTAALGYTPLAAEVDGSTTNEIELPTQTGQSGKVLSTNGTSPSWVTASSGSVTSVGVTSTTLNISGSPVTGSGSITINSIARSYNHTPGRSLVSVAAAANGFQVSSTRDARVRYSVTVTCAVQIGVVTSVEGYVVLEICPTNSSTAGDWIEISRVTNAQNIGLAIALSSTAKNGATLLGDVPAGYYVRIRTVNVAGTPTYVTNGQQEVLL